VGRVEWVEVRFKVGFGFLGCVKGKDGMGRKENEFIC
jgi:hypothetical protein